MTRLSSDPVFSALTRPQMIGGVTYSFAVFNLIVTLTRVDQRLNPVSARYFKRLRESER